MSMPGLVAQPPTNPGGMTCLLRGFLKFLKYTIPTGFRILHGFHYPDLHPGLQIWHAYGISIQVRQAIKRKKITNPEEFVPISVGCLRNPVIEEYQSIT